VVDYVHIYDVFVVLLFPAIKELTFPLKKKKKKVELSAKKQVKRWKTEKEKRAFWQRETKLFFFFLPEHSTPSMETNDIFLVELISNASEVRLCFVNHILMCNYYYDLMLIMQNRSTFQFQASDKIRLVEECYSISCVFLVFS
jgi:hypothetical protein